ncbi:hypothetical protein [Paenibacillus woosongensis]|uniref:Uncharacterized protein n=1 Tax=Paenibacillus woosongensis TaxID=307580 RepID=A0A7X2Z0S3_9BACL|nr:hypothetical protein [Paenibacillus woosongensis]MUG45489.1 hypothetical protein [Paenibacillus woosongensis]
MTRQTIVDRLLALPREIAIAERALLATEEELRKRKSDLQAKEDELLSNGTIDGKNGEIRAAQLRSFTGFNRQEVAFAEKDLMKAQVDLRLLNTELEALKAVVDLLKGAAA